MANTPHFASPFVRQNGKVAVVEQNTAAHSVSQKWMIVSTPLGWRVERPDFGWPWPEFSSIPLDMSALAGALQRFVGTDRSTIEEWGDVYDEASRKIRITSERNS